MKIEKLQILENHCYTKLVYERINKKLGVNLSNIEIEELIGKVLETTSIYFYNKIGKNFYISNQQNNIKITVNSNTFRIITVNKLIK